MNISQVAAASGLPCKTIRYYEDVGLIRPDRSNNGYRKFRTDDCRKLIFLARARSVGFSVEDCRTLLSLYEDEGRSSRDVRRLAIAHLDRMEEKRRHCESLREALLELIRRCDGECRPDHPFLGDLASRSPQTNDEEV